MEEELYYLPVPHVDEGGYAIEGGHHDVRHGEVQQEVVGHCPHGAVRCNTIDNLH